ncbi:MAG: PadR family transcriptional regulator [Promethearchaeota archaeon]
MDVFRKFRRAAILVHVLYHAGKEPVYGSYLKGELERHGYQISYGTLYPWLNSLKDLDLLRQEERNVGGKIRKYYMLTDKGRDELERVKRYIAELHEEILGD